jgi:hypothetical protein
METPLQSGDGKHFFYLGMIAVTSSQFELGQYDTCVSRHEEGE